MYKASQGISSGYNDPWTTFLNLVDDDVVSFKGKGSPQGYYHGTSYLAAARRSWVEEAWMPNLDERKRLTGPLGDALKVWTDKVTDSVESDGDFAKKGKEDEEKKSSNSLIKAAIKKSNEDT